MPDVTKTIWESEVWCLTNSCIAYECAAEQDITLNWIFDFLCKAQAIYSLGCKYSIEIPYSDSFIFPDFLSGAICSLCIAFAHV